MRVYDSHTHLNDDAFFNDVPKWMKRAANLGVVEMNIVGSNKKLNDRALQLAEQYPQLHAIVGWHPEDSKNYDQAAEDELIANLKNPLVVGLGEIGLDYHWDTSPRDVQRRVFARQLEIAKELNVPVSIHCRDAFEDAYPLLKAAHVGDFGGVMHSFNGDPEWLHKFLDLGMHISYSGVASFKNAKEVHESVEQTPLDRLLVETDAPYLTPEPHRGEQNEPGYSRFVVMAVAKWKEMDPVEVADNTYRNTQLLFAVKNNEKD
ncbi:MAG TPA: TatD family hydrolase [Candidatus Limosilactobacillus merdipullorum]|uniref:TatD family hydrolase n=1 Tax=Candidatus Limosilactobacillus merdipullorum TaxID=2838653 RepID=A0A9D1QMN2_9LACO|nr:TatD family hydrolase [Candidatus Limosilactobacillus merdipullorum]